jgi:capsular polysaccharide biosynthesis protein
MFDLLPRLHLIQASGVDLKDIDRFIVNSCQKPFQQETLKLLGIPENKLIESDRCPHIQAKTMLVPSLHRMSDRITNWGGNFLRNQFLNSSLNITDNLSQKNISDSRAGENLSDRESPTNQRLYISRKSAQYRRVLNELEVIEFLRAYGFRTITLESLSFQEQVTLMANATVAIAPHGAGLTNLIFSPPGSVVIELFSPDYLYNLYWLISNLSQLKYYYLIGDHVDSYYSALGQAKPQYIHPAGEDILVNLNKLRSLLQLAGVI